MTARFTVPDGVPGWKLGLLTRIQAHYNAGGTQSTAPKDAHPEFTASESGSGQRHHFFTAYNPTIGELETRALAAGLPEAAIESAQAGGIEKTQSEPAVPTGAAAPLLPEQAIDALAEQVWHLRHMALVLAEYDLRSPDDEIRNNVATIAQLSRNMDALWASLTGDIATADLGTEQVRELWTLDEQGWQHCAHLVHNYDNTALRAHLDAYASPEMPLHLARTVSEDIYDWITQAEQLGIAPPHPIPLSEAATEALLAYQPCAESHRTPVWPDDPGPGLDQTPPPSSPCADAGPDLSVNAPRPSHRSLPGRKMMNPHYPEFDGMPAWKVRLLGRIQDSVARTAELTRVRDADTIYSGRGDPTISSERAIAGVSALDDYRRELEARATAAGIPAAAIQHAHAAGRGGRTSPDNRYLAGLDVVAGDAAADALADQIWQLEHTALVLVEYNHRTDARQIVQDLGLLRDVDRAMTALWYGTTEGIDLAGLTAGEATDLWNRDVEGWRPLASLVRSYDDTGLRKRLHSFASPQMEETLRRLGGPDEARVDHAVRAGTAPPTPYQIIESATEAFRALDSHRSATGGEPAVGLEDIVAETARSWNESIDPAAPATESAAQPGVDAGPGI